MRLKQCFPAKTERWPEVENELLLEVAKERDGDALALIRAGSAVLSCYHQSGKALMLKGQETRPAGFKVIFRRVITFLIPGVRGG